ncbi:MAG: hypothetical protein WAO11_07640, partial [Candidatus Acidiferrum sp.]
MLQHESGSDSGAPGKFFEFFFREKFSTDISKPTLYIFRDASMSRSLAGWATNSPEECAVRLT